MGKIKWYKRDPDAALTGMMALTLEERGAYNTLLDLLYTRDGDLPDDDRFLAGWMRCDVRVWRRIKQRLIEAGKISIQDGSITNLRATSEILTALGRVESARHAGLISAAKSASKVSDNKGLNSTPVERTPQLSTTTATATTSFSASEDARTAFEIVFTEIVDRFPQAARSSSAPIYQWLNAGCTPELILGEVRRLEGRAIRSFGYFTSGIMDAKETLERGPPQGVARANQKPAPPKKNYKQF